MSMNKGNGKINMKHERLKARTGADIEPTISAGRQCRVMLAVDPTGALPAIKPEATAIGIIARWPLENNLYV